MMTVSQWRESPLQQMWGPSNSLFLRAKPSLILATSCDKIWKARGRLAYASTWPVDSIRRTKPTCEKYLICIEINGSYV